MPELRHHILTRDAAVVSGPEAVAYLQGQLSQDVAALEVGASAWSWVLAPAGKVDALARVTRTGPDTLLVDTDAGWGETLVNRLARFKLRTKADITAATVTLVAVRGPGATRSAAGAGRPVAALWGGEEAADALVDTDGPAESPGVGLDDAAWEAERIAAGVPVMGAELTEKTIPAETGLVAATVSFTKGCYTGQELVARIDSRGGNVARHLRVLRSPAGVEVGAELNAGGKIVGTVTSSAVAADGTGVALGYVGRAVAPGGTVDAGGTAVEVVKLPGPVRRLRPVVLAALAVAAGGCGTSVTSLSYPAPPPTPAVSTSTTVAPFDGVGVAEPGVPAASTTTSIAVGGGAATITGTVSGPDGSVSGATVQVQRLVGDQTASTEVVTSMTGQFTLRRVLGGRYRVRAWQAPTFAMTTPQIFFLDDDATETLALQLSQFSGPKVTSDFAPSPALRGEAETVAVEVTTPTVSATGIVDYQPDAGTTVQLIGDWTVSGSSATATTNGEGLATFVASCDMAGSDPLTALVGSTTSVGLNVPPCEHSDLPPATTTTTTTTTTLPF